MLEANEQAADPVRAVVELEEQTILGSSLEWLCEGHLRELCQRLSSELEPTAKGGESVKRDA